MCRVLIYSILSVLLTLFLGVYLGWKITYGSETKEKVYSSSKTLLEYATNADRQRILKEIENELENGDCTYDCSLIIRMFEQQSITPPSTNVNR